MINTAMTETAIRPNRHQRAFFDLDCAEEILDIVGPLHNRGKEITEAMAVAAQMRYALFKGRYTVFDLCAGNGLAGALCAFLFPQARVVGVDVRRPSRPWGRIRRFEYLEADIDALSADDLAGRCQGRGVVVSVHPCGALAERVVELFNEIEKADWLFLMPCCLGTVDRHAVPPYIAEQLGPHMAWTYHLYQRVQAGYRNIHVDEDNLSARNAVVVGSRVGRRGTDLRRAGG